MEKKIYLNNIGKNIEICVNISQYSLKGLYIWLKVGCSKKPTYNPTIKNRNSYIFKLIYNMKRH